MKAATRTVVAKSVTSAPHAAAKTPPELALSLQLKRRIAANGDAEKAPASIKEALVRWLEQEL